VIIRIEKRMISLLCEAICSVKGTMFCLMKVEYVCRYGRAWKNGIDELRSKSESKYYMVPR
jgi:hypothetical protein